MCGIVGIVALSSHREPVEKCTLQNMCNMIRHRGPDGEGYYVNEKRNVGLGHVRLAIIDLKTGQQPLYTHDRSEVISFNGEIYGYKKMRHNLQKKGHIFLTDSDTEVVLNLYRERGIAFVDDLRGEYAFALYDILKDRLVIVRDRFGVKPLYYTTQNGRLRFSSEIKGIFGDHTVRRSFNFRTIVEQMMRADSAARTTFEGIQILPPGHLMIVEHGEIMVKKYWDIDFPRIGEKRTLYPMEYYAKNLGDLFTEAVRTRMVSDVEVGCFLSGGLDSSITAAVMQELTPGKIKTFSIGFTDKIYDESQFSNLVADYIGSEHHCLVLSHHDLAAAFPQANYHCEHLVQQIDGAGKYLLSQYARNFVKVVQVGEGADEVTLGYPWFKSIKLLDYWNQNRAAMIKRLIISRETARKGLDLTISEQTNKSEIIKRFGYYPISIDNILEMEKIAYQLFSDETIEEARRYDVSEIYLEDMDNSFLVDRHPLQQNRYEFFKKTFHTYLMQYLGGKNEMANSIESRLPFLDYEFVEFANKIPTSYHLFGLREKNILRMAFSQKLPREIINRVKHGYSAPILETFLGDKAPDYFREFLSAESLKKTGLFNYKKVNEFIRIARSLPYEDQRKTLYERLVIFVLSVQLMNDMFIENFPVDGKLPAYQ